jgi:hypothetical protein
MEATAWRVQTGDKEEFNYRLQVEGIRGTRAKNRVLKCVKDWNSAGEGFSNRKKELVLIFSRTFETPKAWMSWAKAFPYSLVELKRDGTPKPIKRRVRA